MGTDKTYLLYSLDCSYLFYHRRLLRKWYGIQRWDSRSPTAPTLCIGCLPVKPWSTVVSSSQSTSLAERVSLLSFWPNLLIEKYRLVLIFI